MPIFINSLDDIVENSAIYLYGIGEGCYSFIDLLTCNRPDINIIALIDDNKTSSFTTFPVIRPEDITDGNHCTVFITSAYWVDIYKKLDSIHIRNYAVINPSLLYPHMIMTEPESDSWSNHFEAVCKLLTTNEQQRLYRLIKNSRSIFPDMQEELHAYYKSHQDHEKEYLEFINPISFSTIIEGGVFDGYNTLEFLKFLKPPGCIYGFEPNMDTTTNRRLSAELFNSTKFKLYPYALWNQRTMLKFYKNSQNLPGARIVLESSSLKEVTEVPAISIDEFVYENRIPKIDYIKLDVEGAELDVLQGAINVMQRDRPQLAICIYHRKEHLFQIPLFLDSVLHNYCYFVGHYSPTLWDTVWYAIPEELS